MNDREILEILKTDLQINSNAYDVFLLSLIKTSREFIKTEGATLEEDASIDDSNLIRMYAAYLYRSRKDGNQGMPRPLRYALNNRILHEKGQANG